MMKIDKLLKDGVRSVALVGHEHPDGDCAGSVLGTWHYIHDNYPELRVTAFLEPLPSGIGFLKGSIPVREDAGEGEDFDLAISLDCADLRRIGAGSAAFASAKKRVCIDHHASNTGFGDLSYVEPDTSSNCEILCGLFKKKKIRPETAVCLYTGMAHDTGVFRYEAVTARTMKRAAFLMGLGIPFSEIIRESISEEPYNERRVTARVMASSTLIPEESFLYAVASEEFQRENGVDDSQLGGVVSYLNGVKEAEVVLFLYRKKSGVWKGSLRTKSSADATKIAELFGGGGHVRAAGFDSPLEPEEIIDIVRKRARELLAGNGQ